MADEGLPVMILPPSSGIYKIVQFDSDSLPYLRFPKKPQDRDFHRFILERFALEISVQCIQIPGPDDLIPALPDNIFYRMVGAGRCDVDLERKTANFGGGSNDYKIRVREYHLQKLRTQLPEWQIKSDLRIR